MKPVNIVFFFFLFIGCTQNINVSISGGEAKIVIEGTIENGKPAEVIVTRNSPVSMAVDYTKILVTDAKVYVSNGMITESLNPTIDPSASIPYVYKGSSIIGAVGQTYNLTVIADGKTYTASTTIPPIVPLDSAWWKVDNTKDSLGYIWAHFTDPPTTGNCYQWFAKRATKDRRFLPSGFDGAPSTFNDKFVNGKSYDSFYSRGDDPTVEQTQTKESKTEQGYFKKSDTVYVKFCTIDYATYLFYITYETDLQSNGNPFASPTSIQSNISNGGLGVWAGFGATYDTIYPKP